MRMRRSSLSCFEVATKDMRSWPLTDLFGARLEALAGPLQGLGSGSGCAHSRRFARQIRRDRAEYIPLPILEPELRWTGLPADHLDLSLLRRHACDPDADILPESFRANPSFGSDIPVLAVGA